jgi:hypothetical protein
MVDAIQSKTIGIAPTLSIIGLFDTFTPQKETTWGIYIFPSLLPFVLK